MQGGVRVCGGLINGIFCTCFQEHLIWWVLSSSFPTCLPACLPACLYIARCLEEELESMGLMNGIFCTSFHIWWVLSPSSPAACLPLPRSHANMEVHFNQQRTEKMHKWTIYFTWANTREFFLIISVKSFSIFLHSETNISESLNVCSCYKYAPVLFCCYSKYYFNCHGYSRICLVWGF